MNAAIYSETVTGILRRKYGNVRHATKMLARIVGSTPRTVQNWLDGTNAPRGAELIRLMQECDELRDEIFRIVEEGKCQKVTALTSDGVALGTVPVRQGCSDLVGS
jgi:predicted transcriptional regulator